MSENQPKKWDGDGWRQPYRPDYKQLATKAVGLRQFDEANYFIQRAILETLDSIDSRLSEP